uniref:Glycogen-binding subunit 76A n=2 Tax=Cacopsylla melanoneura TaxID=428564 RepID=A0A8D8W8N2_9HEMI
MSREGLSLDLTTEDPSTCAAQFRALSLISPEDTTKDKVINNNLPIVNYHNDTSVPSSSSSINHNDTSVPSSSSSINLNDSISNNTTSTEYRKLRRCSSLKSGKTPPGTPASKKIVRFVDVMGLDIADVRTYLDEIPKVPQSAYEDLVCPSDSDDDNEEETNCNDCDKNQQDQLATNPRRNLTLLALFNQPGYEPNFFQNLNSNKICLEKVIITQYYDGKPIISGTIRVRNEHFNKAVYVRYTTDQWCTYKEVLAKYIDNSCDGYSDKFSFVLYTQSWGLVPLKTIALCFRYVTNGHEYWDGNRGKNYTFQCHLSAV